MLLFTLDIEGTDHYVSTDLIALTHIWERKVFKFDPPQYGMPTKHGGYCKITYGSISLAIDLFCDSDGVGDWPPPKQIGITVQHTSSTEAAAITIFEGIAYLSNIESTGITYGLYSPAYDTQLLEEAENYDGDIVPLPIAFGSVTHVQPVRLPDYSGDPCYSLGGLSGTYLTDWFVYDDGVALATGDVVDLTDNRFTLDSPAVGEITISGTGTYENLDDIFTWAFGATKLNETIDATDMNVEDGILTYWADSQMLLIDFLDKICQFFHHCFYKDWSDDTIYLVDMMIYRTPLRWIAAGSTYDQSLISIDYTIPVPTKGLKSEWTLREAVEETSGFFVKETNKTVEVVMTVLATGPDISASATGVPGSYTYWATDENGSHWYIWGVRSAMVMKNYATTTEVELLDDPVGNSVETDDGITGFDGDPYAIGYVSDYGEEMEIEPYVTNNAWLKYFLATIGALNNHIWIEVKLPMSEFSLPTFRDSYIVENHILPEDSSGNPFSALFKVAKLTCDFEQEIYIVGGEGGIFLDLSDDTQA